MLHQMGSAWTAEHLNRYLNGVRRIDEALGMLLDTLDDRGLSDSTLVVVVGDHGEAFGRHDQFGHGSNIYEENVHVPLMLVNSALFSGESFDAVGGLIDVAPTILDLVGQPVPGEWQGRSLFSENRAERTYFFSTWKEYSFGYRQGDYKYIYNASRNEFELYDLQRDPHETENLADEMLDSDVVVGRLAAWVQYQNDLIADIRNVEVESP